MKSEYRHTLQLNYYNEIEPKAAAWLRELVKQGAIPPGEVDERDIRDIHPADLMGFHQCHFFAGIGVWAYALELAGWDGPVWTGSPPCQPFSTAGKRRGPADERHLWPAFFHLIKECRPGVVFGEQVASKDGIAWLDTVSSDLEGEGYACGPVVLPACGVGAPHRRERLFFVADSLSARRAEPGDGSLARSRGTGNLAHSAGEPRGLPEYEARSGTEAIGRGEAGELGYAGSARGRRDGSAVHGAQGTSQGERSSDRRESHESELAGATRIVGDPYRQGRQGRQGERSHDGAERQAAQRAGGAVGGFWANAEWIYCKDGKYRAVEPGSFPLAHGATFRVGRLRGYGNAIVAQAAAEVIKAYMQEIA